MSTEEDQSQRINRELIELLNEIRVALPGVQVLLAFLLAMPFSQGFERVTHFQRDVYFLTVVLTVITTVLLIAPSSYHRLNFRRQRKDRILFLSNRLMIVGLGFLALALTGVAVLITSVVYDTALTIITGTGTFLLMAWFWFLLPLLARRRNARDPEPGGDDPMLAPP